MCGVSTKEIYMEIELSSHRREMLLFLTTNMAGVTSHANHQYKMSDKDFFKLICMCNQMVRSEIRE